MSELLTSMHATKAKSRDAGLVILLITFTATSWPCHMPAEMRSRVKGRISDEVIRHMPHDHETHNKCPGHMPQDCPPSCMLAVTH